MRTQWPIRTIALSGVVLAASFLPWASGGFIKATEWNSTFSPGGVDIPYWTIPVIAVFVGVFVTARAAGLWSPSRIALAGLVVFAAVATAWFVIGLASADGVQLGIGPFVSLLALGGLFFALFRGPRATEPPAAG